MAKREPNLLRGLPKEIRKKINKTKQTRGAQPYGRVPYQNRVNRNGVAVVPYAFRDRLPPRGFENGYRILVRPSEYFDERGLPRDDFDSNVVIGQHAFLYYDNRADWKSLQPPNEWKESKSRLDDGHYIARVPATTATDTEKARAVIRGAPQGIRFFEYAPSGTIRDTVAQLAYLAWHTERIAEVTPDDPPDELLDYLKNRNLGDADKLESIGVVSVEGEALHTICPLCLEKVPAQQLMSRAEQTEGREVVDLTITEANLFHVRDLKPGEYNHFPYALGWGHHHCNMVARDKGIAATVRWMGEVLRRHGVEVRIETMPDKDPQ